MSISGLFAQPVNGDITQAKPLSAGKSEVYSIVEEMPDPPGGISGFYKYISSNIVYPQSEREAGMQGKVFVKFVVEQDGSLSEVTVLKGVAGGSALNEEAVRVIKSCTAKWKPGKVDGQPARVYYTLPIVFKIQGGRDRTPTQEEVSDDFFAAGLRAVSNQNYAGALVNFDSCLKYRPKHKDALYNKAVMHNKIGQKIEACNSWNKLLAVSPEDKEVSDLIKKHCN